jgi:hypothetical protein
MTMPSNRTSIVGGVIVLLLIANIVNYFWSSWGLVTIHAKDEPIGKVIKSIEWQGWVTIYSNVDPNEKITMSCDRVPLPDAMETLAANVDDGSGRGGGFGGGGAQWHLGFFIAPTSAAVKAEIRSFAEGAESDDDSVRIYSFPTPLGMLGDDSTPVADPRGQIWPGLKLPPAPAPNAAGSTADSAATADAPETPPDSAQGYLRAFARQSDIWIMAPASWDPRVTSAPAPNSSIISAIRRFVSSADGSVKEGLILRARPPRVAGARPNRGGGGYRGGLDMSMMQDRVDNAINGLPREAQPAARAKLADETQFQKEMNTMPLEQRMPHMMTHFLERRLAGDNSWRRSPAKRAQMYVKLVSNRMAATGK